MGLISRSADLYYTFRFLKLLVSKWTDTDAFKNGIVDKDGKPLKKASQLTTDAEKSSYTTFHRLVFNIKRLLEKVPFGKTRIASYAAALYLIKEHTGMSDEGIRRMLERVEGIEVDATITENRWLLDESSRLHPGSYSLQKDAPIMQTGEFRACRGTKVDVSEATAPIGYICGMPVFSVKHRETGQYVCVSVDDLSR